MRRHGNAQIEIAAQARLASALAADAHALAGADARGDLHVELSPRWLPAAAAARGARLAVDVARAVAGRTRLVGRYRERLPRAVVRVLEADLDVRLDVLATRPRART